MTAIFTFGDSILDCGEYNNFGITPAALLAQNDDRLFPDFRGRDLEGLISKPVRVVARAQNGSTVGSLDSQLNRGAVPAGSVAMLTIGGNDLNLGLAHGDPRRMGEFEQALRAAFERLAHTQLFVGNVYDPTFGEDARNFLPIDPAIARRAHARVNRILATETERVGGHLVDLHAHFLTGETSWITAVIEPSLTGASEVRRAFLVACEEAQVLLPQGRN